MADPPLDVSALILESVYPTIEQAVEDRLRIYFGPLGSIASPVLTTMMRQRLGFAPEELRPIERLARLQTRKFIIFGTKDRHTTSAESLKMFETAAEPKQMWAIEDAAHVDLHAFPGPEYESRVLEFLTKVN